ncbi:MAG: phosphate ABC transporter substrate-binding protein PstS, partial [Nocardioidaceae bacterium]
MRRPACPVLARFLLAAACCTLATTMTAPAAHAAAAISGAGSTFAQIAIDEWRAGAARKLGLEVNYSGQGSSAGRRAFIEGTVDFASSDIPFEPGETVTRAFTYLPLVAGGTALMYNLKDTTGTQIRNLQLSGPTIAKIYFGLVSKWNAPDIAADNPQLAGRLPSTDITPVARSGGSGTTAVFTGYLAAVAPKLWDDFVADPAYRDYIRSGARFTSSFPPGGTRTLINGSDGIANFVAQPGSGAGSIGYAEAGYAVQRGLPMVSVKNQAGRFAQPGARNQAIALTQATRNPDGTQNLDRVYFYDDPESYPISSYNYMIAPTTGFDPAKGETLGRFIIYAITEGQAKAEPLGYSPL